MKINSIVLRNNYSDDGKLISQAGQGELCQDGRATDNRKKPPSFLPYFLQIWDLQNIVRTSLSQVPPSLISAFNKLKLIERNFWADPANLFTMEREEAGMGEELDSILRLSNIYFTQILSPGHSFWHYTLWEGLVKCCLKGPIVAKSSPQYCYDNPVPSVSIGWILQARSPPLIQATSCHPHWVSNSLVK